MELGFPYLWPRLPALGTGFNRAPTIGAKGRMRCDVQIAPSHFRQLSRHAAGDEAAVGRKVIGEERAEAFDVVAPVALDPAGGADFRDDAGSAS